ncbi:unnamed protein product [Caenorhabditis sp. 36 PRJEB53466]|nr:unnamed protein product [Caenorhabditis sp. 36 PRJEB53466]
MVLTVAEAKKLTVPRLKEELAKRGLDASGNKPDLLSRLTEYIQQAAEDLILGDSAADEHHLLNDDILNDDDDILDAPSIDGEQDALDTSAVITKTEGSKAETESEKKEVILAEKKTAGSVEEAQRLRAIRFGIPLSTEALNSDSAKSARADRFGIPKDAKLLSSDEAKAKRAERFGSDNGSTEKPSDEKLAARAARFGLPVGGASGGQAEKLAGRAKRFGGPATAVVDDEETAAKKKARLERFGAGAK